MSTIHRVVLACSTAAIGSLVLATPSPLTSGAALAQGELSADDLRTGELYFGRGVSAADRASLLGTGQKFRGERLDAAATASGR